MLPDLETSESGYIQYQVVIKERQMLPKEGLPCHDDGGDHSLLLCVEDYFQANRSCRLPWRGDGDGQGDGDDVCEGGEDLRAFQKFYQFLLTASEQDIYDLMGCFHTCSYMVREIGGHTTQKWVWRR